MSGDVFLFRILVFSMDQEDVSPASSPFTYHKLRPRRSTDANPSSCITNSTGHSR